MTGPKTRVLLRQRVVVVRRSIIHIAIHSRPTLRTDLFDDDRRLATFSRTVDYIVHLRQGRFQEQLVVSRKLFDVNHLKQKKGRSKSIPWVIAKKCHVSLICR
jgi:hypothetical protein